MQTKEDYWLGVFKQWQTSGLVQKEFCARNEIRYKQFVDWRSRLIKSGMIQSARYKYKAPKKPNSAFVPVSVISTIEKKPMIELSLGHGIVLRMPADA